MGKLYFTSCLYSIKQVVTVSCLRFHATPPTFRVKIGHIAGLVLGLGQEFELGLGPGFKVRVRRPSMVRVRVSVWVRATF